MLERLTDLLAIAGLILLALGLGHVTLNLIGLRTLKGGERIVIAIALGLMAVGLFALGLSEVRLLSPWLLRAACGIAMLILAPSILAMAKQHLRGWELGRTLLSECSLVEKILLVLIAAQVSAILLTALLPPAQPSGIERTGFARTGFELPGSAVPRTASISDGSATPHAPFLADVLVMSAILMKSQTAAQLLLLVLTIAAGGATYLLARRFFSRKVAIIAAAAFMLIPQLPASIRLLHPEPATAFFVVLSFLALAMYKSAKPETRPACVVLISLLCGGAAGMQQLAASHALFIAPAVLAVPALIFRERIRAVLGHALLYAAVTIVLGGVWHLHYYAAAGDYRGVGRRVRGHTLPAPSPRCLAKTTEADSMGKTLALLLAYPWNITVSAQHPGVPAPASPGLLPLAFIPLLLVLPGPVPRIIKAIILYCVAFAIAVFFAGQATRFLVPIFGLTSIVAAFAFDQTTRLGRVPSRVAITALLVACVLQLGISAKAAAGDADPLMSPADQTMSDVSIGEQQIERRCGPVRANRVRAHRVQGTGTHMARSLSCNGAEYENRFPDRV